MTGVQTCALPISDYSDKGFDGPLGEWWSPSPADIARRMQEAASLSHAARRALTSTGVRWARSRFSWRRTAFAVRDALKTVQEQKAAEVAFASTAEATPRPQPIEQFARTAEREAKARRPRATHAVTSLEGVDWKYYWSENPDVRIAGIDPVVHFVEHGWLEERPIAPDLTTRQLIAANPGARRLLLGRLPPKDFRSTIAKWFTSLALLLRKRAVRRGADQLPGVDLGLTPGKPGVQFVGYVEASLGIGESLRGLIDAVRDRTDISIRPFNGPVMDRITGPYLPELYDKSNREIMILEVACDQLPALYEEFGTERFKRA